MRAERWWQNSSVIDQLFNKAGTFEFIQTTRLLRHVPYLRDNLRGQILLSLNLLLI